LFGGPVARPDIYYLFEILHVVWATSLGQLFFYLLEILTTGQFVGQLSNIFSNYWGQFAIGPVAEA
jgi:hypothetical protein